MSYDDDFDSDQESDDIAFRKFDKEKFLTAFIFGLISFVIGLVIISDTKVTPENISEFNMSESIHFISNVLPKSLKELLLFLLGNMLLLVGVYYILKGLQIAVKFITGKTRRR